MFKEFKEFAMKGNVIDLAVGVVIGGAFGKIVASFVSDLLMPLIGMLLGRADFNNLYVVLAGPKGPFVSLAEAQQAGALTLNYGKFVSSVFDFLVIAFAIFLFVRMVNHVRGAKEKVPPVTKECLFCFTEIPLKAVKCPNCTADLK